MSGTRWGPSKSGGIGVLTSPAGSGWAAGPGAVREAVRRAAGDLDGAPQLVLVFVDPAVPADAVLEQAAQAAPGCPLAGMTGRTLLTPGGVRGGGCAALALGPEFSVGVGCATEASRDLRAAGRSAAEQALDGVDALPGHGLLLLLVDPQAGDQADAIAGAYEVAGTRMPLAGGGADGRHGRLLADDRHAEDAVVAVGIASRAPIRVGVAHGCRPLRVPAIATRTRGRTLLELDGRPAEEVYLEGLGLDGARLDDEAFEALAVLHPLAQPELHGEVRLRHVHGRADPLAGPGGLACATPIPPNAAVWPAEQTRRTIIESAAEAGRAVRGALPVPPRAALVFDCAARRRALGDRLPDEARALVAALGGPPALAGLHTRGEVGRVQGAKGDRNHAIVVVGFA